MLELFVAFALCPQEPVVARHERHLPELGTTVRDERVLDLAAQRVVRRTVDADGRAVDADALRRRDLERRDARTGRLHPTLAAALAAGGVHEVAFWLVPNHRPDLRGTIDRALVAGILAEDARRLALALARDAVTPGNAAFAAAVRAAGGDVLHVDTITPVVHARLSADAVRQLAARADVDLAYVSSSQAFDEGCVELDAAGAPKWNEWASKTARTDAVHRRGIDGAGVKVMVNDAAPVATTNPFLPPIVAGNSGTAAAHATAVAGIIASRQVPNTGAAPGLAQIYSYGLAGDTGAQTAWAWGMAQGISFGNCSWWNGQKGQIQFLDRYFDYIIRN
ncbi:MAG: hypothetical protein JNK15_00965, partial [Planctomycetes bacterium]|nr:hypothetical protein [Planctomycetota bacterium]